MFKTFLACITFPVESGRFDFNIFPISGAGNQQRGTSSPKQTIEKATVKLSPTRSSYSQPSQAIHRVLPPAALSNFAAQVSGVGSSSSGKRKASNPQKFTRMPELASASTQHDSQNALLQTSVANALQFTPMLIRSMIQQGKLHDSYAHPAVEVRELTVCPSIGLFWLFGKSLIHLHDLRRCEKIHRPGMVRGAGLHESRAM